MDLTTIIFLSFALAADAFAVAIATGAYLEKCTHRQRFRLSFHFGLFQFLMPLIGFGLGVGVEKLIANFDHWIAFGLLALIGGKMIKEGLSKESEIINKDITKGMTLIALSIATSIDALAVGFSIGVMNVDIWYPSIIIGIVAAVMTLLGISLGEKFSEKLGKKVVFIGGLLLIAIGIKIVIEHVC